jgi:hypothetical protein
LKTPNYNKKTQIQKNPKYGKMPKFKMPNYNKKPKLNSTQSPYRVKSPTSKAQLKKPKFKTPNYNKKPKYRKSPN